MILVYGITVARARVPRPLRLVAAGELAAVVREVRRAPAVSEPVLRAYDRQLRALALSTPALLPARFGTVFGDASELRSVLGQRRRTLGRALRGVRGRAQMTVRLADSRRQVSAGKSAMTRMSGAAYLRARAAARGVPAFDPIRPAVARWVRDERVENHGRVASVYHLVPRASADAYRAALLRASAETGQRVLVSGPHPAYAFTTTL